MGLELNLTDHYLSCLKPHLVLIFGHEMLIKPQAIGDNQIVNPFSWWTFSFLIAESNLETRIRRQGSLHFFTSTFFLQTVHSKTTLPFSSSIQPVSGWRTGSESPPSYAAQLFLIDRSGRVHASTGDGAAWWLQGRGNPLSTCCCIYIICTYC